MHLVCPACFAINRVPEEKLGQRPKCGKCHAPLLTAAPVELTQANFARFLENDELPVVVDFWAPWCGPCKMFAPVYAQAAASLSTRARFVKVNTEAEPQLAARYHIRSIPTIALFDKGREVDRVSGAMNLAQLTQWITRPR